MKLPTFVIIGASNAGTIKLSRMLASHPEVVMSQPAEPHFFSYDRNYIKGLESYSGLYHGTNPQVLALGDASTSYSKIRYYPATIARIKECAPQIKIIFMVRHPLKRIESAYRRFMTVSPRSQFNSINEAVKCLPMMIDSGRYWETFTAFRREFDESSIKVIWFEEFAFRVEETFQDVCRFLEIDDAVDKKYVKQYFDSQESLSSQTEVFEEVPINTIWTQETRRWVIEQLGYDNLCLLRHFGRRSNYWRGLW